MFKRILVPLDGSFLSERAIPVAGRIARATGSEVVLARVLSTPTEYGYGPYFVAAPVMTEEMITSDIANTNAYLQRMATSSDLTGVNVTIEVLTGAVAPAIFATVEKDAVDLIVMSSRGQTGFKRWMLGSVAQKVARYSPVPVLVLREEEKKLVGAEEEKRRQHPYVERPVRILVPLDGSATAKVVLVPAAQLVAALASPGKGALHLARVMKLDTLPNERLDDITKDQMLSKARKYLASVTEHLRTGIASQLKLTVTWSVALNNDVAGALVNLAENGEDAKGAGTFGGCDLIAMSTHGRGGLQRWAMGSVTERVLHSTKLPVLVVRPPAGDKNAAMTEEDEAVIV